VDRLNQGSYAYDCLLFSVIASSIIDPMNVSPEDPFFVLVPSFTTRNDCFLISVFTNWERRLRLTDRKKLLISMFFILCHCIKNNSQNGSTSKRSLHHDRFSLRNTVKTPFIAQNIGSGDIRALFQRKVSMKACSSLQLPKVQLINWSRLHPIHSSWSFRLSFAKNGCIFIHFPSTGSGDYD